MPITLNPCKFYLRIPKVKVTSKDCIFFFFVSTKFWRLITFDIIIQIQYNLTHEWYMPPSTDVQFFKNFQWWMKQPEDYEKSENLWKSPTSYTIVCHKRHINIRLTKNMSLDTSSLALLGLHMFLNQIRTIKPKKVSKFSL